MLMTAAVSTGSGKADTSCHLWLVMLPTPTWSPHPSQYWRVSECYQSLTAHQHQKGHTVPKQVITIATSIQVTKV